MGGYNPNNPSEFHRLNVSPKGSQGVNIEANPAFVFGGNQQQQQSNAGMNKLASSVGGYLGNQSNYTPNTNVSDPNASVGGYSSLDQAQQAAPYASGYIKDPQYGYIPVASAAGNTNT